MANLANMIRAMYCCASDGRLPPGGHFVLPDWRIKLRAKAGAVVYFDSPTVRHHSERPTENGPEFAPRMACALLVSQKVWRNRGLENSSKCSVVTRQGARA